MTDQRVPLSKQRYSIDSMAETILKRLHPESVSLSAYLNTLPLVSAPTHTEPSLKLFLESTLLYIDTDKPLQLPNRTIGTTTSMHEIISRVIQHAIVRPFSKSTGNVLALGYKQKPSRGMGGVSYQCEFPNGLHGYLESSHMTALLKSVGEPVMLHLLLDCALFVRLSNGCLMQLSGIELYFL